MKIEFIIWKRSCLAFKETLAVHLNYTKNSRKIRFLL
nr:MAG TPA: hypothetical protein [Caudoviricetes sp.]